MGWEDRGSTGRYYYQKRREGGRVVSEYFGDGPAAVAAEALAECERVRRLLDREEERRQRAEDRALDEEARRVSRRAHELVAEALTALGFHNHRGQWRRRMVSKMLEAPEGGGGLSNLEIEAQLMTSNPAVEALNFWRSALCKDPKLWRDFGDAIGDATKRAVKRGWHAAIFAEAVLRGVVEFKQGLGRAEDGALEQALIDHAGLCYARLLAAEAAFDRILDDGNRSHVLYWETRLNHAQRRFDRSLETLARVRRLLAPRGPRVVAQINVLQQPAAKDSDAEAAVLGARHLTGAGG